MILGQRRYSRRAALAALVLAAILIFHTGCRPRDREADLDWLATRLPRLHADLFFRVPEGRYLQEIDELRARVRGLDDAHYFIALCRILAALGDDHLMLTLPPAVQTEYGRFPVGMYMFPDGIYVIRAHRDLAYLVGCKLVSIDGVPAQEIVDRAAPLVPAVGDGLALARVPALMARPEVLFGIDVTKSLGQASYVFAGPRGEEIQLQIQATPESAIAWSEGTWTAPTWFRYSLVIWHTYMRDDRTLYVQYNSCQGSLAKETAEIVKVLDSEPVERIVFDMRRNGGGDSRVVQDLLEELAARPEVREPGHLFVIFGRQTFSSGVLNCYDFRQRTNAVFFGEPTGGTLCGFGNGRSSKLPCSGWSISYGIRFIGNPREESAPLAPDYLVLQSAQDFAVGRDTVLEAILRFQPK